MPAVMAALDVPALTSLGVVLGAAVLYVLNNKNTKKSADEAKAKAAEAASTSADTKSIATRIRNTQVDNLAATSGKYEDLAAHYEEQVRLGLEQNSRMLDLHESTAVLLAHTTDRLVLCGQENAHMADEITRLTAKVAGLEIEVRHLRSQVDSHPKNRRITDQGEPI